MSVSYFRGRTGQDFRNLALVAALSVPTTAVSANVQPHTPKGRPPAPSWPQPRKKKRWA